MSHQVIENVRILLCEDDANLGILLADFLRRLNFDVDWCSNGEEGWTRFREKHFDLCLLDINMPEKNVFELLEDIREACS